MSVINTFWIMFKSNSEAVIKGNKEIERSTKDTEKSLKNTNQEAKSLGDNFIKAVEGAAKAGAAFAAFNIIKTGVGDAAALNAQFKIMADLTGGTTSNLKAMGNAAAAAGGSISGALSDIQSLSNQANAAGLSLGSPSQAFSAIRDRLKGRSMAEKNATLNRFGISDQGNRWLLAVASDQEYARRMGSAASRSQTSAEDAKNAMDAIEANANFEAGKTGFFTKLGNKILPAVSGGKNALSESPLATGGAVIGSGVASALGAGAVAKWLLGILGIGSGAGALATAGVGAGAMATGGAAGYGIVSAFSKPIEALMTKFISRDIISSPLTQVAKSGNRDMDFWMSQGYSKQQALGIMANMRHESGGDPLARGDGGKAHGLFQWHPDRRQAILEGTGIDVSTASHDDQLKAAAWEMKGRRAQFNDKDFRGIQSEQEAAEYFSRKFESPAGGMMEAMRRGKTALSMASKFSGIGGGSTKVQIDKIEINTQASDADGIAVSLRTELESQLSLLAANSDDGQDR